jgi:putative spermidine/putrescine transport system ATP-binding protein
VVEAPLAERLTGRAQAFAIRPELIRLLANEPAPEGQVTAEGVFEDVLYHGASSRCHVRLDDGTVLAVARAEPGDDPLPAAGTRVRLAWPQASAVPLA